MGAVPGLDKAGQTRLNENGTAADTGFSFVLLDVVIVRRRKSQGRALNAPFWLR